MEDSDFNEYLMRQVSFWEARAKMSDDQCYKLLHTEIDNLKEKLEFNDRFIGFLRQEVHKWKDKYYEEKKKNDT